jgi:hypothetical protein
MKNPVGRLFYFVGQRRIGEMYKAYFIEGPADLTKMIIRDKQTEVYFALVKSLGVSLIAKGDAPVISEIQKAEYRLEYITSDDCLIYQYTEMR